MFKRFLIILSLGGGLLLAAVLTLPWWLGSAARWIGEDRGLQFSEYETIGYSKWVMRDVHYAGPGFTVVIDRLEAPHPLIWWQRKSGAAAINVGHWKLTIDSSKESTVSEADPFTAESLIGAFHRIAPWVPEFEIGPGEIFLDAEEVLRVAQLTWAQAELKVQGVEYNVAKLDITAQWQGAEDYSADAAGDFPWLVEVSSPDDEWTLSARTEGAFERLSGQGSWRDEPFAFDALFADGRWIPVSGELQTSRRWELPGAVLGLGDQYDTIGGEARLNWTGGGYTLVADWTGTGREDRTGAPPFAVNVAAEGDLDAVRIDVLEASLPGLSLTLSEPITVARSTRGEEVDSSFSVEMDLEAFPWLEGSGTLTGVARLQTRQAGWPQVDVELATKALQWRELEALSVEVDGRATWPDWEIKRLRVEDAHGGEIEADGSGTALELAAGRWRVRLGEKSLSPWLPTDLTIDDVQGEGMVSGSWPELEHQGSLMLTQFKAPNFHPVDGRVDWRGQGLVAEAEIEATSQEGVVKLAGGLQDTQAEFSILLTHGDAQVFETLNPLVVDWTDGVVVRNLHLRGQGIDVSTARFAVEQGALKIDLDEPNWDWTEDWWESLPLIPKVRRATADVAWRDQSLRGSVRFDGDLSMGDNLVVQVQASASTDGEHVIMEEGTVGWQGQPVGDVSGEFPVRLRPVAPYWEIEDAGAIDAAVTLSRSPELWRKINEVSVVKFENPELDLSLSGTWQRPRGTGRLTIDRVKFAPGDGEVDWPVVTALVAQLVDDGDGLMADPITARLDGQPVTLQGRLPFTPAEWSELMENPLAYLRDKGHGTLSIPRAELSALAKFVPDTLVPTGTVEVELSYAPGTGLNGRVGLQDAVSRPLGPLGVLQGIQADLVFENRGLDVRNLRALMGGQPITLTGEAQWPRNGAVEMDLRLQGKNLPLVRNTGILLRSDLDLRVRSDKEGPGEVSGEVRLRDGLVLVDVRSLVPRGGGAAVPARRPPYFSVGVEPINTWTLDVGVTGEHFLRLQTPVLTGIASVDARLDGTLETPRAIGEITLNTGELRLPFARLDVDESYVRLTEADPYDPEILLHAGGQRLGYDLTFELTGKSSDPRLDLQSSPVLSSEEVLLLVMAGVTPRQDGQGNSANRALKLGMYFSQGILGDMFGTDENERLGITTGEKLSRQGKETYRFDYQIADRWTLVAEYDEFDHYNAGVKWRVRPAPPPEEEPVEKETEAEDER